MIFFIKFLRMRLACLKQMAQVERKVRSFLFCKGPRRKLLGLDPFILMGRVICLECLLLLLGLVII